MVLSSCLLLVSDMMKCLLPTEDMWVASGQHHRTAVLVLHTLWVSVLAKYLVLITSKIGTMDYQCVSFALLSDYPHCSTREGSIHL